MLNDAVKSLTAENNIVSDQEHNAIARHQQIDFQIDLPAYIPETYMPDVSERVAYYQRIGQADAETLLEISAELDDIYGKRPVYVSNLIEATQLKALSRTLAIEKIHVADDATSVFFTAAGIQSMHRDHLSILQRNAIACGPCEWKVLSETQRHPDADDLAIDLSGMRTLLETLRSTN